MYQEADSFAFHPPLGESRPHVGESLRDSHSIILAFYYRMFGDEVQLLKFSSLRAARPNRDHAAADNSRLRAKGLL
jgi:hypothetical protein